LLGPLAVALSGCGTVHLGDSLDIALYQSDDQRLTVTNATSGAITIVGQPGVVSIKVEPGASLAVPFRVATIGTAVRPKGAPYWTLDPGGYTETFRELNGPRIVDTTGSAPTLNFHDAGGVLVKASISLTSCGSGSGWARQHVAAADHPLRVPDPIPAVPQAVCP
jgi:hypothetical protein